MRIVRVVQVLLLILLVAYLAVLGSANPQTVFLPLLISLPTVWVIVLALLLGFLVGWLVLVGRTLKLQRENRGLRQRLIKAGLEAEPLLLEQRAAQDARRARRTSLDEPPRP